MIDPVQHAPGGPNQSLSADSRLAEAITASGESTRPAESADARDNTLPHRDKAEDGWDIPNGDFEDETERESPSNWLDRPWVWPLFGCIGLLVFELTTSPGLAVAVFCMKLGMSDVRLGLWLAKHDPQQERGTITGLMAASLVGLKITLASLVISLGLLILSQFLDGNAGQNPAVIGQCAQSLGITAAVAMCVSLAIARLGFFLAKRAGQKVWLESNMRKAPTENVWPLECVGTSSRNMVIDVAQFCFLLQIPILAVSAFLITAFLKRCGPGAEPWGVLIGVVLQILSYIHLRITIWKVAARHPGECWPELLATRQFRGYESYLGRA